MPPLNHEKLLVWWRERLASAAVFLLLRRLGSSGSSGSSGAKPEGSDLVGVIMVRSHPAETSPHVAAIELLLVNMQYRELGGEQQLLATVEQQAVREGRTLLVGFPPFCTCLSASTDNNRLPKQRQTRRPPTCTRA